MSQINPQGYHTPYAHTHTQPYEAHRGGKCEGLYLGYIRIPIIYKPRLNWLLEGLQRVVEGVYTLIGLYIGSYMPF